MSFYKVTYHCPQDYAHNRVTINKSAEGRDSSTMVVSNTSPKAPNDACIIAFIRTPLCRARKGGLAKLPPSTLLSTALKSILDSQKKQVNGISPSDIGDICVGNVLSPASGAAALRMACLQSGIPSSVPMSTTNRQCSSGLQAVAHIASSIEAGNITIGIGAGVESMSTHPMNKIPMPDVDWDAMQQCQEAMDCLIPMGVTSENVSKKYGQTREELDRFAVMSHRRAAAAQESGKFENEIVPVGNIYKDDGIRSNTTMKTLSKLKPVFDKEKGTTTAGNASQMTDGAASILLMARSEAERRNLPILATWRGYEVAGVPPKIMGIGPAVAIPKLLHKCNLTVPDINLYEINEAFASQALYSIETLGIDINSVNVNGGAISLGHPLGATGARQIATVLNEMRRRKNSKSPYCVISMCIGTGMGAAALLEIEDGLYQSQSNFKSSL